MTDAEHRDVCGGYVKPQYDRDSGRHVVGWKCGKCGRQFETEQASDTACIHHK